MQSFIKTIDRINDVHSVALVQVIHANGEDIRDNFAASVSAVAKNDLNVVPGTSVVIEQGRDVTMVRTLMQRTEEAIPLESASAAGIISVSGNMYMGADERFWTLRSSESGDVLVRDSMANDNEELINMIRSVSSASPTTLRSQMPETAAAFARFESQLKTATGGDMVAYLSKSGTMEVGFVAAEVEDLGETSYLVVPASGEEERVTSRSFVTILDGSDLEASAFPALDSVSAALGVDVNKLVDYYRKVFSYRPEYFAMLEQRIRQHSF